MCRRVQFDRRELAVELVKDVDVMPIDPLESLPPALLAASGRLLLNGRRAVNGIPQVAAPAARPDVPGAPLWTIGNLRIFAAASAICRQPYTLLSGQCVCILMHLDAQHPTTVTSPLSQERGRHLGWQDGTPQRGPAAGRAQQEARAAASEAQSADLRALAEVCTPPHRSGSSHEHNSTMLYLEHQSCNGRRASPPPGRRAPIEYLGGKLQLKLCLYFPFALQSSKAKHFRMFLI